MRLQKLKLHNFRCFGPDETVISFDDMTALIGANSSGKTAVLHALVRLFGLSSKERYLQRSDFYVHPGKHLDELEENDLYIEAVIVFPELANESPQSECLVPPFFNQMIVDDAGEAPYVRIRLSAKWIRSASPEGDIDQRLEFILVPEGEGPTEEDTKIIPVQSYQRSQIQVVYVPAVRDPGVHLKAQSSAIIWRLLRAVRWRDALRQDVKCKFEDINRLFLAESGVGTIQNGLRNQWGVFHDDNRYGLADIEFAPTEMEEILKRVQIMFRPTADGSPYDVDQLGDGLRSLFYLTLVAMMLELESKVIEGNEEIGICRDELRPPALTILALEEPENHLSPHLLGKVVSNCYNIAKQPGSQVIITSHTPALLKRVNPEHIRHLRFDNTMCSTAVTNIELPENDVEAYKYVKQAVQRYPEMYFSKLVVLGEGDTEEIVLKRAIEARGRFLDSSQISVVPLGGRHVNYLWKLLHELGIPYVTLLDLDRERPGGGWGRIQYALKQLLNLKIPKSRLLHCCSNGESHVLTDEELEDIPLWDIEDTKCMNGWLTDLRQYDVFFAEPLDLDFMMLTALPEQYRSSYDRGRGPKIPESDEKREKRLERAIISVLKKPDGCVETYSEEEIELFPWYSYLFLGRSKPSTHIAALRSVSDDELIRKLPEPLKALIDRVSHKLNEKDDDGGADCSG
jgi:putative ATP-dependent endonuclease of OLD family